MSPDEELFRGIVRDFGQRLYWHVRRFTLTHEDADDLVQDIYVKIWNALPSFRGEAQLYTWVWRIATNEALNFVRREKVRTALRFRSPEGEADRLVDSDPWLDGSAAEKALSKAVARLPDKQRQVFIMRYYDELPYEEMSRILGTSEGALKASYHIARGKVEAYLKNLAGELNL